MVYTLITEKELEKLDINKEELGLFTRFSGGMPEEVKSLIWGKHLRIGKYCQIGSGAKFLSYGLDYHPDLASNITTYPLFWVAGMLTGEDEDGNENCACPDIPDWETVVGNDVYIGEGSLILPGVHIGDGAIIEPGSVIREDIEPYTIIPSSPAKAIYKRFDDELISLLGELNWWDRDIEDISSYMSKLYWEQDPEAKKDIIREYLQKK